MATAPHLKPLTWPPIRVDTIVSQAQFREMVQRVEANFRHMGETEPHWSVLSTEKYLAANIGTTEQEFFESGKAPVEQLRATATRCGVDLSTLECCLELGCGLGRSTIWLAEVFRTVVGADISAPHLRMAADIAARFGRTNISFLNVSDLARLATAPAYDAFFSLIVLQHNPPPIIHALLSTILGRLRPGGIANFQVPTYRLGYEFDAAKYLATPLRLGVPEMHVIPQPDLHALIEAAGCRVLEMREDGAAGGDHISSRLFLRKMR
jgi:SAM-dependent methyltransferase